MRNIKIVGYGAYLPAHTVTFEGETRYRCIPGEETQLDMAVIACQRALAQGGFQIQDIDCIVSTAAVGIQPIPCSAALIHEKIALGTNIPAFDINSTCTSFVTGLDMMSYLLVAGRYKRILIISSELCSIGLNQKQKESYELFSDGACAFIFEKSDDSTQGIVASLQHTWSEGAHSTEMVGGLTYLDASKYAEDNKDLYYFSMHGKTVISICARELPKMMKTFNEISGVKVEDIDLVIPHQASRALSLMMRRIGVKSGQYMDRVKEYGNQVSVSIPFMLYLALTEGLVKKGDQVLLCGTAAGLTANVMLLRL